MWGILCAMRMRSTWCQSRTHSHLWQRFPLVTCTVDADQVFDRMRFAVLDAGTAQTLGSVEAIERIMELRHQLYGQETVGANPDRKECFNFGNAQERKAESYALLPQRCNGQEFSLGVYTLDVPGVPILLGVQTMRKLGAVIDVGSLQLCFHKVFSRNSYTLSPWKERTPFARSVC